jgi:stage II sporulation protein D
MSEAETATASAFAQPARGTYAQPRRCPAPQEPMQTSHLTSPSRTSATPRRRGRLAFAGALAALALLVGAGPAAATSTQYAFTITGHGWGHGVGMSQWGAYGYAKHGWTYRAILKHYYTGISLAHVGNPAIRVNLRSGLHSVALTCPNDFTVRGTGKPVTIPAGQTATTTIAGGVFHVVAGSLDRDFTGAPTFAPTKGALRLLTATDLGDTGAFRGTVKVVRSGSTLVMVDRVSLESYLRGVVPHEASPSWPAESLKAQACAARAYGLVSLQPGKDWDVYCDVRDQTYAGVGAEDARTTAAVRATAGICPSFGGKPILATYFSCSGGHTENIELAWAGSSPVAYLKGVTDPYDYYGSRHDWGPLLRSPSQLGKPLAANGSPRAIFTVVHGTSPRIVKAAIIASKGTTYIDGGSLRMKLGLNSAWAVFTSMGISPAARDGAAVTAGQSITLSGRLYPGLAASGKVYLHSLVGGTWHSRGVATTRTVEKLPGGYSARYSAYTVTVSPAATTKYYFSSGKAESPRTTVKVQ